MHNLDMTNGRANIAFTGSRKDVWHRMGQEMKPGMSIPEWAKAAGLDWKAIKVPNIVDLSGSEFNHLTDAERKKTMTNRNFIVRSDNGQPLGFVSENRYQAVQPSEVLEWFEQYIGVDDRFQLDVAGSLGKGEVIWATATFRDALSIAGDKHVARILMTTTFDGTGSTINQGTMTRVVCNNTLDVATMDKRAVIRTTHAKTFDKAKVGRELAILAQGFAIFKKIGDALAQVHMASDEVTDFFKTLLEIPAEAKPGDISTRITNQLKAMEDAFNVSKTEGATGAWAALNAITRYVDHDRIGDETKSFKSANFDGTGKKLKAQAMQLLMPRIPAALTA